MNKKCLICEKVKPIEEFYMSSGTATKRRRKECRRCTQKHKSVYDWKISTSGWQYSSDAPRNRQWRKDRAELFAKNGNGWWWFTRSYIYKKDGGKPGAIYNIGD
tara:strand:- start:951 stop:1262 length:312 start_codon:yes stop_codon:yes gene_type:complete